jgi:HD-like signal output (HDOD) protein
MKRILFVDDEPSELADLKGRLHSLEPRWTLSFVDSGARAIEELERVGFDVVVSDLRMPGMDGAELLRIVSERWPETIRIVLYGDTDESQILRLVPHAHHYLVKSREAQQLESVIDRSLRLQQLLQQPELRAVVGRIHKLPAMPKVYARLRAALASDNVTTRDVAQIVADDPVIAAKVLQLVNSAFFRLTRRMTNIEQAVTYLGFSAIRNLTLSVEVFSQWPQAPEHTGLNLEYLQTHVHQVAAAARALAAGSVSADDALLAGLVHDIGYWILAQECGDELDRSVALAAHERIPMHIAETRIIGASHAQLGAYLLGIWGLPYPIVDAVAHHHVPLSVKPSELDLLAVLAIAHSLVPEDDSQASPIPMVPDPKVDAEYLLAINAPFSWVEATRRVQEALQTDQERS